MTSTLDRTEQSHTAEAAGAVPLHCPLPACPVRGPAGWLWLDPYAGEGLTWQTRLAARDGVVAGEASTFAAVRRTLTVHARTEHRGLDPLPLIVRSTIGQAAHAATRTPPAQPSPLDLLPLVAACLVCERDVYRCGDVWFDELDGELCTATAETCQSLDHRPHWDGTLAPGCRHCDAHGPVFWAHEVIAPRSTS